MKTIQDRLDGVKRLTKVHEAATVAIALATFALVFFATEIALDRLFLLDRRFRTGALVAFGGIGAGALLLGVLYLFRRLGNLFAARVIESQFPTLRQSLITYVQMQSGDAVGSDEAMALIERRLASDLESADVRPVARRRLLGLAGAAAAIALLFMTTSAAIAGRGFFVCLDRAVRPGAFVAPPTQTRIVAVAPGDAHVLASADVAVTASMEGSDPGAASVYLAYEEGTWFSSPMRRDGDAWRAVLPGAQGAFRYFIAAGDTRSDIFTVTVLPPPMLTGLGAVIDLPAYTKLGQRVVSGGDLELLPRSYVTLRGYPNRALKSAAMVFDTGERIPFRIRGVDRAVAEFTATTAGPYRLELEDEFGLRAPAPQRFRIDVQEDRAPEVAIVQPGPLAELLPEPTIQIVVDARDDYGIVTMDLHFIRRGQSAQKLALPYAPVQGARQTFEFRVQEFGLTPPDSMLYWIEAADRAPVPHVGRSAIHVLHLRRRPTDALAEYEPLKKSLRDLAASEAMRKRLDLEERTEKSEEQKVQESKAMDRLRDLLAKQRDLTRQIAELGPDKDAELKRVREELKEMIASAKKSEAETRDLPSRGVAKQESLAEAAAEQLRRLERRAQALRKELERLGQDKSDAKRSEAIRAAAKKLAEAAKSLEEAARHLQQKETGRSLDAQADAQKSLEEARQGLDDQLGAGLDADDRRKAEELAKLEKLLRERTAELRETANPEEAERMRKAEKAMREAQRALEQSNPAGAEDSAEQALDELEEAEQANQPPAEQGDIPEELAKTLTAALRKMLAEQEAVSAATRDFETKRSGGLLTKEQATALHGIAKREAALADQAKEIWNSLERDHAEIYRWMIDQVREDLVEARDLMEAEERSDSFVQHLQDGIVVRLKQLIEALKPQPRPPGGAGAGGGGSKAVNVGFEAQLKLIRAVQLDLLARTREVRAKADVELTQSDRTILNRLYQQQDDLRKLVVELAEALEKDRP